MRSNRISVDVALTIVAALLAPALACAFLQASVTGPLGDRARSGPASFWPGPTSAADSRIRSKE